MNCSKLQRFWGLFFVALLLLTIVKSEAYVQVKEDISSINSLTQTTAYSKCPHVRALSEQKKERLENESNRITKQVFSFLFPGSPRVNSLLGTFYISSIPNFILYFVPPDIQPSSLNSLVSFAVGGLLGDVFLHLLPQSFLGENSDDEVHFVQVEERKNVVIGLAIFVGLTLFFVIDKLMRVASGGEENHSHVHDTKKHEHEHQHDDMGKPTATKDKGEENHSNAHDTKKHKHEHQHDDMGKTTATKDNSSTIRQRTSANKVMNEEKNETSKQQSKSIKLSAYLNLIADATHNFTDGLAMAASFYASPSIGATTTVAVFFHEIPHEIGDYAILIQSGFTKRRAMLSQFITAIGAFLGTIAGIVIEEYSRNVHDKNNTKDIDISEGIFTSEGIFGTGVVLGDLIIPFTAGGFLYIATVGVIPELLEINEKLSRSIRLRQAMTEFLAMLVGITMMAVIAWNESV